MRASSTGLPLSLLLLAAGLVHCADRDGLASGATSSAETAGVAFQLSDLSAGGTDQTATPDGGALRHEALDGDMIDVRLSGLVPSSVVTVHARTKGGDSAWYEATATFTASPDGTVDVATTAPTAGTYDGADPDGLFWSGVKKPDPSDATANGGTTYFRAESNGVDMATAELYRYGIAKGVSEVDVTDDGLVGAFYAPASGRRRGAVIAFGGSDGGLGTGKAMAAHFASLGYPALGVAYFGAPGLPPNLAGVPLEYFQKAHDWLVKRPEVDPSHIAVWGYSRGGELALLLGATFPWVTAVFAGMPSGVLYGDDDYTDGTYGAPSWTLGGQPIPYLPYVAAAPPPWMTLPDGTSAMVVASVYQDPLTAASPEVLAAATTQVENTQGAIFIAAGADDKMYPGCTVAQIAMDRLTSSGHAANHGDELVCYPGAGHFGASTPGRPTASDLSVFTQGVLMAVGGDPRSIARAQRDADTRVRAFFAANLP